MVASQRSTSALALVHSRFSTNTFPSWPLAHPYRMIAHNGEINTVMGNRNWMRAREGVLRSEHFGDALERAFPIMTPGASDTASFDECLELLHLGGRSLPHAVLMMIPEAWENHESMPDDKRAFYAYHASLMEPWDGPASIAFTDGTVIGAVLDRNGLRPSRYWVTEDGLVVMASEVGVLDLVRFHRFTIGWAWTSDYGSPDDPDDLAVLLRYSPYHRLESGRHYPPTLITTGDTDDRVVPAHSFKFAAALQAAQGGDAPVLLRVDTSAGHGVGKPVSKLIEERADVLAFHASHLGLEL